MAGYRVVGFDPGLRLTGYAVLEQRAGSRHLLEAGVLRVSERLPLAQRVRELHRSATEVLSEHSPHAVAVEELFSHYERPRTAILMGHARGVLLLAAADCGAEVMSYLPTQVKKATTGSGRATKEQMQRAIQVEFNLKEPPNPPDVADAIAIALCHLVNHALFAEVA